MRFITSALLPQQLQEQALTVASCPATELPDAYLEQLIAKSREPHIFTYETSGTTRRSRFADKSTFHDWAAAHDRIIYLLLHMAKDEPLEVGGIIWFGPKTCPLKGSEFNKYDVTFSIRLFESCLGKGLSRPFMAATHADALSRHYPGHAIWLDTGMDNEVAHRSYRKFGYKDIGVHSGRRVMGYQQI